MQEQVYEYFNEYFNGTLNESTSDEDIMEAVYDLVDLTESVLEEFGDLRKSPYAPKTGWTSSNTNRSLNQDIKSTRSHIGRVNRDDKNARKKMDSQGVSPNAPIRGDIQRKSSEKLNTLHGKLNKLRQKAGVPWTPRKPRYHLRQPWR
jgi:hypothetical protein